MVEFFSRLVSPMERGGGYMYRHRAGMGQLIGMALLAILCYQFTIIGDNVYAEAMRSFIMNPSTFSKLEQIPMLNVLEINLLLQKLQGAPDLWNLSSWLVIIVKATIMSIIIGGYSLVRQRKAYGTTIMTGVFHAIAYSHLVVGVFMLSMGFVVSTAKLSMILTILLGFFLVILCILLTVSLLNVVGRIIGACLSGEPLEGLLVMTASYIVWIGFKVIGFLLF